MIAAAIVTLIAPMAPAHAAVTGNDPQNDSADLAKAAHAVIIGKIERRRIGIEDTIADIRITQVISGPLKQGQAIRLRVLSGRVRVDQGQPDLTGVTRALLFLGSPDAEGRYTCVQDNYGFKPIIHDRVYTNPQDPLQTMPLKKYQASLISAGAAEP